MHDGWSNIHQRASNDRARHIARQRSNDRRRMISVRMVGTPGLILVSHFPRGSSHVCGNRIVVDRVNCENVLSLLSCAALFVTAWPEHPGQTLLEAHQSGAFISLHNP
jgi:hypothetical protein